MKTIYLDYAAATPIDPKVLLAMKPFLTTRFYNPSSLYLAGKSVKKDVQAARSVVAHWLGIKSTEVIFTAGGTEANNLAIHGVMQQFLDGNVVVSAVEHEAVLEPASRYKIKIASVKKDGLVDINSLAKIIDDKTVLVSIMYANNEVGTIQPIKQVASLIKGVLENRKKSGNQRPLYFHTDACQAAAYLDLHTKRLGVDMMTINSGKIYGPKQCGALYVRTGAIILPQVFGGGQEAGMRSGTENVANIVGFAKALDIVQNRRVVEVKRLGKLQALFIGLLKEKIPSVVINGSLKHRLPNNVHITLPGKDNERLMMQLDELGVQCAVGSACSASSDEPSHVLQAMGLDIDIARASLRFSMGRQTIDTEIRRTIKLLAILL